MVSVIFTTVCDEFGEFVRSAQYVGTFWGWDREVLWKAILCQCLCLLGVDRGGCTVWYVRV